jgi:hypothetical protein
VKRKMSARTSLGLALTALAMAVTMSDCLACDTLAYENRHAGTSLSAAVDATDTAHQAFPYGMACGDKSFAQSLVARFPLLQVFSMHGRDSILRWDPQFHSTGNPAVFDLYSDAEAVLGGGFELALYPRLNVTVDWARYSVDENTIHSLAMGVSYRFD